MLENAVVSYERHDAVAVIVINRPPVNAIDRQVRAGLMEAISAAEADVAAKVVVLACAGRTFLSGADLTEFDTGIAKPGFRETLKRIENCTKPVVAVLHGTALGGGLEVALACHYRIAVPSARLGLPEITLGIIPGAGGTQRLPRLIGAGAAFEIMLSGSPVTADKARDLGLVDAVVDGEPVAIGKAYAQQLLADGAPPRRTSDRQVDVTGFDDEGIARTLKTYAKALKGRTTQQVFVKALKAAVTLPFEQGLDVEEQLGMAALATTESRALRHAFFAERNTARIPGLPAQARPLPVRTVAVVGAGTMGSGIAMAFGNAGIEVTLIDAKAEGLARGAGIIRTTYESSAKRGRMSAEEAAAHVARIQLTLDMAAVADVDLVVEAVFEDMALKKTVLAQIDRLAAPRTLIATNTSSLSVEQLAAATSRPDKVLGLHFFSPAHVMRLLEIVRSPHTSADTLLTALDVARRIRKIGVVAGDAFGFIGNRMMLDGYFREAEQLLLEGASPQQVDAVMENFGFAMGPNRVNDMGGIDIGASVREQLFMRESRADPYSVVSAALAKLGHLGQKTGRGFYRYDEDPRIGLPDPEVTKLIAQLAVERGIVQRPITDAEIEERCVLQLIKVGADILAEGVAYRPADIDVVWLAGYGFPRHLGGPMFYADALGLPHVAARIRHYHAVVGGYWEPSPLLEELAESGSSFAELGRTKA